MYDNEKSILIIEDEPLIRSSIVELLELKGHNVYSADNGRDGIRLAVEKNPSVILCDIMMPEISGLEVIQVLKETQEVCTTPFIFLSAKSEKKDVRRGMELGADDYLCKPFRRTELYNTIDTQLAKKRQIQQLENDRIKQLKLSLSVSLPHELRTPLNGIHSSAQFLILNSKEIDTKDRVELYQAIAKSSRRLNRLIQNYLLFTELELYDDSIKPKPEIDISNCAFDPEEMIHNAYNGLSEPQNLELDVNIYVNHSESFAVMVKANHLQKIIEELISNAIKFHTNTNKKPKVTSNIDITKQIYLLEVTNYGNPLSAAEIDSIGSYVQFRRDVNEQQGLGLGLFIVQSLVNMYGGKLTINSSEENGNSFLVELPAKFDFN